MVSSKTEKIIVIGIIIGSFTLQRFTDILGLNRFIAISSLTVIGFAAYKLVQKKDIDAFAKQLQSINDPSNLNPSTNTKKIREELNKWAAENYTGRNGLNISWDFADLRTKPLRDWDETLVAITGAIGQNETPIQVFIETSSMRVTDHNKVRHKDQFSNPFKYSDYYQEYKRSSKTRVDDIDQRRYNQNMMPTTGFPPGSYFNPGAPPPKPSSKNDDEDN